MIENWVEKYRPKTLNDVIGQNEVIHALQDKVNNGRNISNLIFVGRAGTGKTSTVKALARDLFGENWEMAFYEKNASNDRGIEIVRKKIIPNCKIMPFIRVPFKIIFLDESDGLCLTGDTEIIVGSLKNPSVRQLNNMIIGRKVMIPSVNHKTLKIENDYGRLVYSGDADFFEIIFADGSTINASLNHPFFKIINGMLSQIKLKDLKVGDTIVEVNKKIYRKCRICGKYTLNKQTCSRNCQDKYHAAEMMGKNNHRYGKVAWNKGLTKEIDKRIEKQRNIGGKNGNYGGTYRGKNFWDVATEEEEKLRKREIIFIKSRPYKEQFGERELEERLKRHPKAKKDRILTNLWIKEERLKKHIHCEICKRVIKTSGRDKNSVYIHHKDGDHNNHIPENLSFVCPKCHNMVCHDAKKRFLEKGWEKLRGLPDVHNGIEIIGIKYIGKQKAWNISMERNKNFILRNGIVTHNTNESQDALCVPMEKIPNIRWILSCNNVSKIIEPIVSRCTVYEFKPISKSDIVKQLQFIAQNEGLTVDIRQLESIADLSKGDLRKSINMLQMNKTSERENDRVFNLDI